ncbi:hypothetical protein [Polaribacter porphyrae]|uniref:Uncharacterized protein n=1 Tax=Polaribacter porphyrae TaxID=1137780 RepID=A0A2S7WP57_9FLAO|nr:hypothetical protein [Polaribacter porphyrae]PQJ79395.1 hypothetical protein BTO18_09515 [Polaribacter porphyrae]
MNNNKVVLQKLISVYLNTRKIQIDESLVTKSELQQLLEFNALIINTKGDYELNTNSLDFNKCFLKLSEKKLKSEYPKDISGSFLFIDNFEKHLQKEYNCERVINSFSSSIKGLKGYVLYVLHTEYNVDVISFLYSISDEDGRENHLFLFEDSFFRFIQLVKFSVEVIFEICNRLWEMDRSRYKVVQFLRNLSSNELYIVNDFLEYVKKNDVSKKFASDLLIGIYNHGNYDILEKIGDVHNEDRYTGLATLSRLNYYNFNDLNNVFGFIKPLEFNGYKDS